MIQESDYFNSFYDTDEGSFEITLRELIENVGKYENFAWVIKKYGVLSREIMLTKDTYGTYDYATIWFNFNEAFVITNHEDFPLDTTIMIMEPRK